MSDIATLYAGIVPLVAAMGIAFLAGIGVGLWVVLRFCEVKQGGTDGIAD